jgi:hypothetical protein
MRTEECKGKWGVKISVGSEEGMRDEGGGGDKAALIH